MEPSRAEASATGSSLIWSTDHCGGNDWWWPQPTGLTFRELQCAYVMLLRRRSWVGFFRLLTHVASVAAERQLEGEVIKGDGIQVAGVVVALNLMSATRASAAQADFRKLLTQANMCILVWSIIFFTK